jgi:5,5'-dehydrodivanillate O-demethylase oxygenase subunit
MLDRERNEALTRVGPGTPMGELMRRYWQPIAALSELDDNPTKPVRLMGEDLTLYKDLGGNLGLIDRHCPHRSSDMSYGYVEKCGLRCNYHGWLFDHAGRCIEQPYEEMADPNSRFKDKVRIKAYPVEAKAGLVWAYLGPEPRPLVPTWEPFTWPNGFVQIVFSEIPCNWFQCQENSIDPVHFEWMHSNWKVRLEGRTGPYTPKHLKVDFDEFEWGFVYKRILENTDDRNPLWTVGRTCLWPNALFTGNHFEWRVPVDDETTLSVGWFYNRVPRDKEPFEQKTIPYWYSPIKDPKTGRWITSHVMNQDFIAWMGQGAITDRGREHLGLSDRGVIAIRKRFFDDMARIEKGEDPKAVVRDRTRNSCIDLPIPFRAGAEQGLTRQELEKKGNVEGAAARRFIFQAGQPDHVRRAYEDAMGITMDRTGFVEAGE